MLFFSCTSAVWVPLVPLSFRLVKSRPVAEAISDQWTLMYHRKLEGEQNHLGVQGHRATHTSPVSWSSPDGGFVTLACSLAFFSQVDGRACRSKTVDQEHAVFSHGLSREVGMVYDVPQGRTMSESLMLQVFLQLVGSADIDSSLKVWEQTLWSKDSNPSPGHRLHKCHRQNVSNLCFVIKAPVAGGI